MIDTGIDGSATAILHAIEAIGRRPEDVKEILLTIDRAGAIRWVQKQAALDFDVACFGHGPPIVGAATHRIRSPAESL